MKLLQINTILNSGSTGRIAEDIGKVAMAAGFESYIAAGHTLRASKSKVIEIGSGLDRSLHRVKSILFDRHGFASLSATRRLVKLIEKIKPDVIHLHNIHGYYLNIKIIFDYLKRSPIPVVWTLHDCWPFTGHCTFFDRVNCNKWQTECNHCPNQEGYPRSIGLDQSRRNFYDKKRIFTGVKNLVIVTPSLWLANHVQHSFLSNYPVEVINNGVDLDLFPPAAFSEEVRKKYNLSDAPILLGVANTWDKRKGLSDFIELSKIIKSDVQIVLVGLSDKQLAGLPVKITGIKRTENSQELAALYATADLFINPTYVDNFPTTNIESLACGTPVITYKTGGSPEAIDDFTGFVTERADVGKMAEKIELILKNGKKLYVDACRQRAEQLFNKEDRYKDYINLYSRLIKDTQVHTLFN